MIMMMMMMMIQQEGGNSGFKHKRFKTDSAQISSNKCKNYFLKTYSQHINFFEHYLKPLTVVHFSR